MKHMIYDFSQMLADQSKAGYCLKAGFVAVILQRLRTHKLAS